MTAYTVYMDASSRYSRTGANDAIPTQTKVRTSSIGVVIKDGDQVVTVISKKVGQFFNTYSEFLAMQAACMHLISTGIKHVHFYADCIHLVTMCNQRVISAKEGLKELSLDILSLLQQFDQYTVTWIPRSKNKEAHFVASKAFRALDVQESSMC